MNLSGESRTFLRDHVFGPFRSLAPPPLSLLFWSVFGSFALTFLLVLVDVLFGNNFAAALRTDTLDQVTGHWLLDPSTLHIVLATLCSLVIFFQGKVVKGADLWSRIVASGLPFVILVAVYVLGDLAVKPAFAVARPPDPLPEPPLTARMRQFISSLGLSSGEPKDSMPSGFVMRQTALVLVATWQAFTRRRRKSLSLRDYGLVGFSVMTLAVVGFSRVYRGAHSSIDISAAIGVGVLMFWMIVLPPYNLIKLRFASIHRAHLSPLVGGSFLLFFVLLPFSNQPAKMIQIFAICIIYLGGVYIFSPVIEIRGPTTLPRNTD